MVNELYKTIVENDYSTILDFIPRNNRNMLSYVYCLYDSEYFKIGITSGNLKNRISQLQTGNPRTIIPIMCSEYPQNRRDIRDLEQYIHGEINENKRVIHNRICGDIAKSVKSEWFSIPEEDILSRHSILNIANPVYIIDFFDGDYRFNKGYTDSRFDVARLNDNIKDAKIRNLYRTAIKR